MTVISENVRAGPAYQWLQRACVTAFFLGHGYSIMVRQCFYHLRAAICVHVSDFLGILIDQLIKFVRGCDRHRYKQVVLHFCSMQPLGMDVWLVKGRSFSHIVYSQILVTTNESHTLGHGKDGERELYMPEWLGLPYLPRGFEGGAILYGYMQTLILGMKEWVGFRQLGREAWLQWWCSTFLLKVLAHIVLDGAVSARHKYVCHRHVWMLTRHFTLRVKVGLRHPLSSKMVCVRAGGKAV